MLRTIAPLAVILIATPAIAQDGTSTAIDEAPVPEELLSGDSVTVGVGAAYGPDYEGSNDYRFIPGAIVRAEVGGLSIVTRGLKIYVDVVPDHDGPGLQLDGGVIGGLRLNRTGSVDDPVVDLLPERKTAIEIGGFAGISYKGLTNPYDKLSLRLDAVKDVNGAHGDWVITPNVTFATPLSLKTYASLSGSLDLVGNDYNDYYFGITPSQALLDPALTAYDPGGGAKSWTLGLLVGQSLDDTILEGWSLFGTVNYKRMMGDAADSPLVADFGSKTQWFAAAGVGYTF